MNIHTAFSDLSKFCCSEPQTSYNVHLTTALCQGQARLTLECFATYSQNHGIMDKARRREVSASHLNLLICFTCTLTVKEFVKINMSKPKILLTPLTVAFIVILKNVLTLPISKSRLFNKITLLVLQQFLKKITQHRKVVLLMRLVSKYLNNTRC